ncbi:hypothetical protein [Streptococcus suis]|uniref:Uncharacterized protein n=1 Tax=Streptococcus suis R61 TaxID=996306 RepID=A0AA87K423_STRSU|nr:hypothetical protein [Streptococcus suis]ANM47478.1 hypothetical protein [Streptococcus phage phiJH1301-1]ATZ02962.1 hypothetical protein CVO91_02785 [Streptococcus suis]EHC02987.1 hypothetical protein SSUR61_0984 [Streptococcus suis R61]MBY5001648.1 hypothetical protein [Streptococcus suis]MBY5012783.1 hypothetical protein [Streptococcus suis]
MRVKVLKEFTDDELGFVHRVNDIIELTKERHEQMKKNAKLQDVNLADYIEEIKTKGAEAPAK